MSVEFPCEPNPIPRRLITRRYLDDLSRYFEGLTTVGRGYGLLPANGRGESGLPFLHTPDALALPGICAIGVGGHVIVADASVIDAFDTQTLPVGRHDLYACLSKEKIPSGDLFEDPGPGDSSPAIRGRLYRRHNVILAAGNERLRHLDWLKVAELERIRTGGVTRTLLNARYHPPVLDMRAYLRPNPIERLAEHALAILEDRQENGDAAALLRVELTTLRNIAETATPLEAFIQAQRCVGLLRLDGDPRLAPSGKLEGYAYDPETFCRFLADLDECFAPGDQVPYPQTLEIDSVLFMKTGGELVEEDEFWVWAPGRDGFVASGLAIYLPAATPGVLPIVKYGPRKLGGDFEVAEPGHLISGPGSAIVLTKLPSLVGKVYLTVDAEKLRHKLRQQLGDGHAVYYF